MNDMIAKIKISEGIIGDIKICHSKIIALRNKEKNSDSKEWLEQIDEEFKTLIQDIENYKNSLAKNDEKEL